jgi:membrane protease YdiL (CAAX protease family)
MSTKRNVFWKQYILLLISLFLSSITTLLFNASTNYAITRICSSIVLLILVFLFVIYPYRIFLNDLYFRSKNVFLSFFLGMTIGAIFGVVFFKITPGCLNDLVIFKEKYTYWMIPFFFVSWLFSLQGALCLLVAVSEEVVFRAIMLPNSIAFFTNKTIGVIITTLTFIFFHYGYFLDGNFRTIIILTFIQIITSILFLKVKNILLPISLHYSYDLFLIIIPSLAAIK